MRPEPRREIKAHEKLSSFARLLLAEWRKLKLPVQKETIIVAVSGGVDSTALLLALDELRQSEKILVEVYVAHLDHRLRESSAEDARWVSSFADRLGYASVISSADVGKVAGKRRENLEQVARKLRYEFLERTAKRKKARLVLTAHTMDDQAETVLLRLMRGSAGVGLGGMEPIRRLSKRGDIQLVRPLLWARRSDTEDYCHFRRQEFLVDEMNCNESYARVRVRQQLLPLMESFNNKVVEAISRTATLLREDSVVLYKNAGELLAQATIEDKSESNKTKVPPLSVQVLSAAPPALRRRALRDWIAAARGDTRRLEMTHFVAVERLLEGSTGGRVAELPNGAKVTRRRGRLEFEQKKAGRRTTKRGRVRKNN